MVQTRFTLTTLRAVLLEPGLVQTGLAFMIRLAATGPIRVDAMVSPVSALAKLEPCDLIHCKLFRTA